MNIQTSQLTDINRIFSNYAFKNVSQKPAEQKVENAQEQTKREDIKLIENDLFSKIDIEDIRKSAAQIGEELSDEDIKYGLTYGRSVLADFSA